MQFSVSPFEVARSPPEKRPAEYRMPEVPSLVLTLVTKPPLTVPLAVIENAPAFELSWRERDGPPVPSPTGFGFGSRLINAGIAGATNRVEIDYAPDGLRCSLHVSMADFQSES